MLKVLKSYNSSAFSVCSQRALTAGCLLSLAVSSVAFAGNQPGTDEGKSSGSIEQLAVQSFTQLDNLPSVSAQCWLAPTLYAVGDDSPAIYALNKNLSIQHQLALSEHPAQPNGRVSGDIKADLEACQQFEHEGRTLLVMLGSGTATDTRERALLFYPDNGEQRWVNIRPFYRDLRRVVGFDNTQFINIEGLMNYNGRVYLLSRGSHGPNVLFSLHESDWLEYLTGEQTELPAATAQTVTLPALAEREATLSGATYHAASQHVFFTASVDKHDDGGIIGSLLLALPANQLSDAPQLDLSNFSYHLVYQQKPLASKVESVVITDYQQGHFKGILAADNDDGSSQFMHFSWSSN
ncbi:hypothetical protein CHH28_10105 [Bacterioplanes sanyensis]|uniref:Uncharacterized protein n=1 Tax=Bacterioplanes sanyensis TaxID=1249553 RepID=A0A222FJ39_9GAMM|nr:hypothetical protein [Bacterioplanes sanyensis]ASP39008.1 hypothetical protein CHH28_10105 [Bacterioplanes sanyensis]